MFKINSFIAALLVLCCTRMGAQSRNTLEDQAYDFLNAHDYVNAYATFDKLHARYPAEIDYHFKLGICCLHYPEKKDRAIEIFREMKAKYKTTEIEVYLGKAYHMNYKFDDALATLNPLVDILAASKKKEDQALIEDVKLTIMNCENGKTLIQNKVIADIENIGPPINTNETEGVPIITADESVMMYTYVGKKSMGGKMNAQMKNDASGIYLSDIFMSRKDTSGKNWLPPEPVTALNTRGNDAAIALSPDGLTLFTFMSNNENEGDIQVSKLNGKEFSPPVSLNSNINTPEYWEGSCSISADGKYLYFSSERPTGLGGRDIYVSEFVNGDWGPAVSLGPKINTIYDDDAPFIHPDGITLFFSSKGHTSIGGYDIMFSIKEGNEWTAPKSMGIPLNTVEDDSYYVINSKGDKGFFSSTRDAKGAKGEQDIYMVTPGILGDKPVVAILKGTVYGNDKPIEAKIDVVRTDKQEHLGPYLSNKETGKYLTALSPGSPYKIRVEAEGYTTVEEEFDIERLGTYMEKTKDFYLYAGPAEPAKTGVIAVETKTVEETTTALNPTMAVAVAKEEIKENVEETHPELVDSGKKVVKEPETTKEPEVTKQPSKAETIAAMKEKENEKKAEIAAAKAEAKRQKLEEAKAKKEALLAKKEEERQEKLAKQTSAKQEQPEEEDKLETAPCNSNLPDMNELKGKSLNDTEKYATMMKLLGEYCADGLVFTVQIGAYKKPENYKYKNLKDLGKVSSADYPDGITRFTQKQFNTLKEAEKQRQKAIGRGQKDAWIVAFYNGKRYTLEDLIMVDFLGKPIN